LEIIEPRWGSQEIGPEDVLAVFFGSFPGGYLRGLLGIFLGILADLSGRRIMAQGKHG
jgi:hypothetical protein